MRRLLDKLPKATVWALLLKTKKQLSNMTKKISSDLSLNLTSGQNFE
jgi:hypothetical protein